MFPGSSVSWVHEKPGQNPGFTLESENLGTGKALGNTLVQAPLEMGETGCIVQEDRRCEEVERVRESEVLELCRPTQQCWPSVPPEH